MLRRSKAEQDRYDNTDRLISAAYNGQAWEVKQLIPVSDVDGFESKALRVAIERNHIPCVELLLPHTNPHWVKRWGLRTVAEHGRSEMVRLFVPHCDGYDLEVSTMLALKGGHADVARALLPLVNVEGVLHLLERYRKPQLAWDTLQQVQAEIQKQVLEAEVDGGSIEVERRRKM